MKILINRAAYDAAISDSDLSEAIEARVRQQTFVEAMFVSKSDQPDQVYVATYDLGEAFFDFSEYAEMREYIKTCPATFFKSEDVADLNSYMFALMTTKLIAIDV